MIEDFSLFKKQKGKTHLIKAKKVTQYHNAIVYLHSFIH